MKIRSILVENYKCLRSVKLDFTPLTVLVGPNASGKGVLLEALAPQLAYAQRTPWPGLPEAVRRNFVLDNDIPLEQQCGPGAKLKTPELGRVQTLQLDTRQMRLPTAVAEAHELDRTGSQLANVFQTIPRREQEQLASRFCELVPLYGDVVARPGPSARHHRLVFQDRWQPKVWYEPSEVSDGTLLLLALLTLGYMRDAPDVLAIEDPEHALHPFLVGQVIEMLRSLATGNLGKRAIQVVLATHSAELLDHVKPEEVRFVSRDATTGETLVSTAPTEREDWRAIYDEYQQRLGDMWLSGGLGGAPGTPSSGS